MASPRQVPGSAADGSKPPRQSAAPSGSTPSPHPTDPSPAHVGTPPAIPNIPPRAVSGSSVAPRSFSTSLKQGSLVRDAISRGMASSPSQPSSRPSIDNLGSKLSPTPGNSASALTAALGGSPSSAAGRGQPSSSEAEPLSRKGSLSPLVRPSNSRGESGASTPRPGDSSFSNIAGIPDEQKAKVLRRHLVSAEERGGSSSKDNTPAGPSPGDASPADEHGDYATQGGGSTATPAGESGVSYGATSSRSRTENEQFPLPYDAPGGDVTHDLYKWQNDHRPRPNRSASFSHVPLDRSAILDPTLAHIKEPGGFRRNFVVNRAQEQGLEPPSVVRNVVDFLFLYGHFAGEDLEEDEEEEEEEEGFPTLAEAERGAAYARAPLSPEILERALRRAPSGERAPLLGARAPSKTRHKRTRSGPPVGTASLTQAVLMLLKGFVGTGILFMGKAFFNGGIVFSTIVLLAIAMISLWSFLLLTKTYLVVPGSFGDIGGALYGNYMRLTILASIAFSQIGFVAAYTIFIAENMQAFVLAVTDCRTYIATRYLIFAQLIIFMPLAMIRNLAKLSGTALVADAFILIGLIYIGGNETAVLAKRGVAEVQLFNKDSFPLLIGTAVFAFEGIGLVIPITESMREPQKFPRALTGVMFTISILFAGAGVLGYAAYGKDIQTVVIVNLPQEDKFVQAVQFLYSVAILLSTPLQLFPAVRIMENGLFSKSGKHNPSVKWQKNVFRGAVVVFCSLLSWAGSSELDKFVALVGSFACIPLCFIYPPLLHLRACAHTRKAKILDWTLIIFGVVVGVYTTVQTVGSLFEPGDGPPKFGKCEVPQGL